MISAQASAAPAVQTGMRWWKVELDKSGAILSVEQVADVAKGSKLVAYIQATTKAEACTEAKAWYARRRVRNNAKRAAQRERYMIAGKCVNCGKRPLVTKRECRLCVDTRTRRQREIRSGDAHRLNVRYNTPEAARVAHLEQERRQRANHPVCSRTFARLWDKLRAEGVSAFEAWLVQNMSDIERQERGLDIAKPEAAE